MNKAVMNIQIQVSLWTYTYYLGSGLAGTISKCNNLERNCQTRFQRNCLPARNVWEFQLLHIFTTQLNIKKQTIQLKNGWKTRIDFFQRGNADGQRAHEKMLNITNHHGNANQNHNELSSHTYQNGCHQKEHINAREGVKKKELWYTVGRNVNWYNLCGLW